MGFLEATLDIEIEYNEEAGQTLITYPVDSSQEGIKPSISIESIKTRDGGDVTVSQSVVNQLEHEIVNSLCREADDAREDFIASRFLNPSW